MRTNLYVSPRIGLIDQGSIFNGGIAEKYENCEVFGIIITPRCDIAHEKVSTYHYLPIVRFEDWLCRDFWEIFSQSLYKDFKEKAARVLINNNLSVELLNHFDPNILIEKCKQLISKEKDFNNFQHYLSKLDLIACNEGKYLSKDAVRDFISCNEKLALNIIKEVVFNRRNSFYFLESWKEADQFFIVLLREINKIPVEIGEKISKGFLLDEISDEIKYKSEINLCTDMIYCETNLGSPFIEHLIQVFFQNFGRIGVEDHSPEINKKIEKLIQF